MYGRVRKCGTRSALEIAHHPWVRRARGDAGSERGQSNCGCGSELLFKLEQPLHPSIPLAAEKFEVLNKLDGS